MDIFELNKLNEIKEYIAEIKDILEINTYETEQKTINKVIKLIESEKIFNNMLGRKTEVELLEHLVDRITNEL